MKRILILAALAALTFASCQKNEVAVETSAEANAITFDVYSARPVTKAPITYLDTLKSAADSLHHGFGVMAIYTHSTDGNQATYKTTDDTKFMYQQYVSWSSTKWVYAPAKYWPNNPGDVVSFFAYAPYKNTVGSTETPFTYTAGTAETDSAKMSVFTVHNDVKKQEDFLFASSVNQTKNSIDGTVKLTFKHQLARIDLYVVAAVDSLNAKYGTPLHDSTTITVNEVTVGEKKGNKASASETKYFFTAGNLRWGANGYTTWSDTTGTQSFVLNKTNFTKDSLLTKENGHKLNQLNDSTSFIMAIPQYFKDGFPVSIKYTVKTVDGVRTDNSSTVVNTICVADVLKGKKIEMGKIYKLNLRLGMTSVKFDVEVTDWATGETIDVDLPANFN